MGLLITQGLDAVLEKAQKSVIIANFRNRTPFQQSEPTDGAERTIQRRCLQ